MKRRTAKPSRATDHGMQFFTPELYRQFNSGDDGPADRAQDEWEATIARYQRHLDEIHAKLPRAAQALSTMCLHDAELLTFVESAEPDLSDRGGAKWPAWSVIAVLSFQLNDQALSLIYHLWDHLMEHPAPTDWPFSRERRCLLYDEIDAAPRRRGRFLHRLLLSDGVVMEVPFLSVLVHRFALPRVSSREISRMSA